MLHSCAKCSLVNSFPPKLIPVPFPVFEKVLTVLHRGRADTFPKEIGHSRLKVSG